MDRVTVRNQFGSQVFLAFTDPAQESLVLPEFVRAQVVAGLWKLERREVPGPPGEAYPDFSPPDWKVVSEVLHEALVQVRAEAEQKLAEAEDTISAYIRVLDDLHEGDTSVPHSSDVPGADAGVIGPVDLDPETVEQARAAIDQFDLACMAWAELYPEPEVDEVNPG